MASAPGKSRRWLRWTCTLATTLFLIIGFGSVFYELGCPRRDGKWVVLECGVVRIYTIDNIDASLPPEWFLGKTYDHRFWWRPCWDTKPLLDITIPLWIPVVVLAIPTAGLWRSELLARKRNRNSKCQSCGYSMLGLAANAPCPECGKTSS